MAEPAAGSTTANRSMSLSMKATVYGIQKKFPAVKNINCDELETLRKEKKEDLIILVRFLAGLHTM